MGNLLVLVILPKTTHMSSPAPDEIDLQQLAVSIVRYFQRYLRFISISSVVGVFLGLGFYLILPPVYESQMIVMSDILTSSYSDRLTESLDRLIKEDNDSILAERLNLTAIEAKQISEIEIESVKKEVSDTKDNESSTFIITVSVKQKSLLPKLQNGLISYLRNNEYVKTRVRQREEMYKTLIEKLDQEIQSLDSLKSRLFQGKPVYSKSSEMLLVDPTNIYSKIIELTQQRIGYKNALELFNSIQLIEGFTPFKKPASPKLSVALVVGFALGFFGAIGLLTLKQLLKMARESGTPAA